MISLDDDKNYYILIDLQGGTFGGGRILEGEKEVFEQFEDWAEIDEIDIKGFTLRDLIERWEVNIKKYKGVDFEDLLNSELDIKKIKLKKQQHESKRTNQDIKKIRPKRNYRYCLGRRRKQFWRC